MDGDRGRQENSGRAAFPASGPGRRSRGSQNTGTAGDPAVWQSFEPKLARLLWSSRCERARNSHKRGFAGSRRPCTEVTATPCSLGCSALDPGRSDWRPVAALAVQHQPGPSAGNPPNFAGSGRIRAASAGEDACRRARRMKTGPSIRSRSLVASYVMRAADTGGCRVVEHLDIARGDKAGGSGRPRILIRLAIRFGRAPGPRAATGASAGTSVQDRATRHAWQAGSVPGRDIRLVLLLQIQAQRQGDPPAAAGPGRPSWTGIWPFSPKDLGRSLRMK